MDPLTALGLVSSAVQIFMKVEPVVAQAVTDFKPFAISFYEKLTGKPITDVQRAAVESKIDDLHKQFQQPIPPADQQ